MISPFQKIAFFSFVSFLALQSAQAMDELPADDPAYQAVRINQAIADLTPDQKEIAFQLNTLRNTLQTALEEKWGDLMSGPYTPDFFKSFEFYTPLMTEENMDGFVNSKINDCQIALQTAGFPEHRAQRISTILLQMQETLSQAITPLQAAYHGLKRREENITEEDVNQMEGLFETTRQHCGLIIPPDVLSINQFFFSDNESIVYDGPVRPLQPLLRISYEFLEAVLNAPPAPAPAPAPVPAPEAAPVIIEKKLLNPEIKRLLGEVGGNMEARQHLNNTETVMAYGNVLAPGYFPQMLKTLPELLPIDEMGGSKEDITKWLQDLDIAESRTLPFYNAILAAPSFNGNWPYQTQNPAPIWKTTYNVVRKIYEQNPNDSAKNLVTIYALKLAEQNRACTAGGIGRNFQVFFEAYKLLAERKLQEGYSFE